MLLEGKRAIVTGGSRGIGRAISIEFAKQGCDVVIGYFESNDEGWGNKTAIESVAKEVRQLGRQCECVEGNIALPETARKLVDTAVSSFGGVDVLASNAGICAMQGFLDLSPAVVAQTMEVNLHGAFYITQAVGRQMKEQGAGGSIVGTSSISALVGGAMQTHYTPTKAGVHSLMQSCAIALGPYGIRCNSIMPGAILTDLNKEDFSNQEKLAYFNKRIPIGRIGRPEDVATCAAFLASDMASYVTGASLLVDGGMFVNLQ